MTRYEVIPAGYTPEDWHAVEPQIMAQLRSELALARFAKAGPAPNDSDNAPLLSGDMVRELLEHAGIPDEALARVVHTYKGEGLTACGLEVVGPCPDCAEAAT